MEDPKDCTMYQPSEANSISISDDSHYSVHIDQSNKQWEITTTVCATYYFILCGKGDVFFCSYISLSFWSYTCLLFPQNVFSIFVFLTISANVLTALKKTVDVDNSSAPLIQGLRVGWGGLHECLYFFS